MACKVEASGKLGLLGFPSKSEMMSSSGSGLQNSVSATAILGLTHSLTEISTADEEDVRLLRAPFDFDSYRKSGGESCTHEQLLGASSIILCP